MPSWKGRPVLALVIVLTFASGCGSSGVNETAPSAGGRSGDATGSTSAGGTADTSNSIDASAPAAPPYANVTAVTATGTPSSYTFNVTIESADIDCTQYADWWEVLTEDGTLVYRRILEHSHTDANGSSDPDAPGNTFTRSGGPVPVSDGDVVVVRAHMSVGGYNGAVMRGSVSDGFTQATDLAADFAAGVEQQEPQPSGCES